MSVISVLCWDEAFQFFEPVQDELDLREQQLEALEGCLGKLPKERRQLVLHVYAAEHPMKTVAEQIGKTPEALYKLLSRVRRQLLQCVEHTLAEAEL